MSRLPKKDAERVRDAIDALTDDSRPRGFGTVAGTPLLGIRVGSYRIIYEVREEELVVLVVRPGHRREVYRNP